MNLQPSELPNTTSPEGEIQAELLLSLIHIFIHHREGRLLGHNGTEHWLILIIHSLSAIYQWSTLYGNLALIISYLIVSYNCTDRHIKMDADDIALLDVLDREITLVGILSLIHI